MPTREPPQMPSLICRSLLPELLASLFRLSTATSTLPRSWMEVCACAKAGTAAATASATSDFFMNESPGFLDSIDGTAAKAKDWIYS